MSFWQVQNECARFLRTNPSEIILMRIKEEFAIMNKLQRIRHYLINWKWPDSFGDVFLNKMTYTDALFNWSNGNKMWCMYHTESDANVTLNKVRRKVVLLRDFPLPSDMKEFGIDWKACTIQDNWNLASIVTKTGHFINHFRSILDRETLCINFTSANGNYVSPMQLALGYYVAALNTLYKKIWYTLNKVLLLIFSPSICYTVSNYVIKPNIAWILEYISQFQICDKVMQQLASSEAVRVWNCGLLLEQMQEVVSVWIWESIKIEKMLVTIASMSVFITS